MGGEHSRSLGFRVLKYFDLDLCTYTSTARTPVKGTSNSSAFSGLLPTELPTRTGALRADLAECQEKTACDRV